MKNTDKGDIAVAATIWDLTNQGYVVFRPVLAEQLRYDLVATKDHKVFIRFQVKYSSNGKVYLGVSSGRTVGETYRPYLINDFDQYAVYNPERNIVSYIGLKNAMGRYKTNFKIIYPDLKDRVGIKHIGAPISKPGRKKIGI